MSFPRYPQYKDSGVEWLGEVPGHWEVKRLRYVTNIRKGKLPTSTHPLQSASSDLPYLSMEFLRGDTDSPQYVPESPNLLCAEHGDILLLWDGSNAGEFLRAKRGVVSSTVAHLSGHNIDRGFLFYTCKTIQRGLQEQTIGMGIPHVSGDELRARTIACPQMAEQTQIAAFLDRETAKIDDLVAQQRRLMELLKEKRQAVISHAVTQGLNPQAPMKPSGIEWLGDVPAHWATPAMYMRYSSELGKMLDSAKITGKHLIPYMRNVDVQWGVINFDELPEMDIHKDEYERYIVKAGDLLVCEGGEVGRAAIVPPVSAIFGYQKALHRLRALDTSEDSGFMYFTLLWAANTGIFDQSGSSTIAHLTGEQLRKYRFPKPPIVEQRKIAAHLVSESAKFDTLTTEAQRAIDLLQERRTALISAAVTGQIDIRQAA
jgi:type I restriction enzyme, S subunit